MAANSLKVNGCARSAPLLLQLRLQLQREKGVYFPFSIKCLRELYFSFDFALSLGFYHLPIFVQILVQLRK